MCAAEPLCELSQLRTEKLQSPRPRTALLASTWRTSTLSSFWAPGLLCVGLRPVRIIRFARVGHLNMGKPYMRRATLLKKVAQLSPGPELQKDVIARRNNQREPPLVQQRRTVGYSLIMHEVGRNLPSQLLANLLLESSTAGVPRNNKKVHRLSKSTL